VSALTLSTVAASLIVSVAQPSFTGCIGSPLDSFSCFGNRGRLSYRRSAPKDGRQPVEDLDEPSAVGVTELDSDIGRPEPAL
jgi:hypothetical protein